jgi:hypothetical protein
MLFLKVVLKESAVVNRPGREAYHKVPTLRMCGALPVLLLYAVVVWTEEALSLRIRTGRYMTAGVPKIRTFIKCFLVLSDADHVQGVWAGQFYVLRDSSVTFLEAEQVSLNLNGYVVQWKLNKTGNVCMLVTLRRVRVTIFAMEEQ